MEWHTSHLTRPCLKQVHLTLQGKYLPECPSAMFRGSWAGAAAEILHHTDFEVDARTAVEQAFDVALEDYQNEGRQVTDAVMANRDETEREIGVVMEAYSRRIGGLMESQGWTTIGTEVPIRWPEHSFASHLDLLLADDEGNPIVFDWKWTKDAPTHHYLHRNMQLGMYWLAVAHGSCQVQGEWVDFDVYPRVFWCHLPNLKPYHRTTTTGGHTYRKGDDRPLNKVLMECHFRPDRENVILDELATRVALADQDLWPTSPDPIGCYLCPCEQYCPRADTAPTGLEQKETDDGRSDDSSVTEREPEAEWAYL